MIINHDNNTLKWCSEKLYITATAYGNGIRIQAAKTESINDYMPILEKTKLEKAKILIDNGYYVIENKNTKAIFKEVYGELEISFLNQENAILISTDTTNFIYKLLDGQDYSLNAKFSVPKDEKLFGMGQYQTGQFDLKGSTIPLFQTNMQISIPYVISNKGYGFFWNNPSIGQAVFNDSDMTWSAERTEKLDFWIVYAKTPKELVESFTDVVGKAPTMPKYGMGFWQSRLRYWNQNQLIDIARNYKKRNIPLDVIVCDFYHYPKLGDMKFDTELFPNPSEMIKELDKLGTKLMISFWPLIETDSSNYQEMREEGLLVNTEGELEDTGVFGTVTFFDMTNPETVKYVWNKCNENYYDNGIKLFWLDEIEPTLGKKEAKYHNFKEGSFQKIGNLYPLLCEKAFYDALKNNNENEIINLSRSAWAGSQKYGALVWSGDVVSTFESFRRQIIAGQQIGITGISWWNTDIGGFSTPNPKAPIFKNLLIRWFQYGTFTPVLRMHGNRGKEFIPTKKDGTKLLFSGQPNEIWSYGKKNEKIMSKYIQIRESLRPYTEKLYTEAHEYGSPIIRTLFYEFPNDNNCWNISDEYFYGADMLVAPITKAYSNKRIVYLPKGADWVSAIDGKTYPGGTTVVVKASITQIPVFLRDGNNYESVKLIGKK